jgi:integrase
VGPRQHSRSFRTKTAARSLQARLVLAVEQAERFDAATGLPASWAASEETVATWAAQWVRLGTAEGWAPRTRSGHIEVLGRALPLLVSARAPQQPEGTAAAVRAWLAGETGRGAAERVPMPSWLARWSLPLDELTPQRCTLFATELAAGVGRVGPAGRRERPRPLGKATRDRYRRSLTAMLNAAVSHGHLQAMPWPKATRVAKGTARQRVVDPKEMPSPAQAMACIDLVRNHRRESEGYRILFLCIYLAGLRPAEARALNVEDCVLPDIGQPELWVRTAVTDAGAAVTDPSERFGDPKADSVRRVPIPALLADELRDYIGDRASGLLVQTRHGNPPSQSNLDRAWQRVRSDSRWRLYDLRHAMASFMLATGVPAPEIANRLGHSVETLTTVYAHVISGQSAEATRLVEAALSDALNAAGLGPDGCRVAP